MLTLDTQLFYALNSLAGQSPLLDGVIVFFATYLAYLLILLFLAFAFFRHSPKREKWELLLVAGASAIIARFGVAELIRFFYHHPRPFAELPGVHALFTDNAWSFPSGHATFFFALSTAVYLYNKKWGIGFFVAAILVTAGRVAAGVHYPSDILGGALIGIIVACAVYAVACKVMIKMSTRG
ncbi:MAG: phosphatase PAP2 family protein [Candidatus Parcubacteria bacterium]|nr:phosphatase PAP2 family protein [Candidatus Parcubacteria bacterium]